MKFVSVLATSVFFSASLFGKTYEIDTAHSEATFKIRHLISKVSGRFDDWTGKFTTDDKTGALTSLTATIKVESINTNNAKRDTHLRSEDFFAADKFPEITFKAEKLNLKKGQRAKMAGELSLHGITKMVTWDVEFLGTAKDPFGNERAALTAQIPKLNRKDYGLTWNKPLEKAGEVLIGDDVAIDVTVEAIASTSDAPVAESVQPAAASKADRKKK